MISQEDKVSAYKSLLSNLPNLLGGVEDWVSIEANVTALLKEAFPDFFWVGFYNVNGEYLHLGPFQGSPACYAIRKGRGVCGTSWEKGTTILVEDVEKFPGHIACSNKSRSEIVVPVFNDMSVIAVLDIDSDSLAAFDNTDKLWLERICQLLGPMLGGVCPKSKSCI